MFVTKRGLSDACDVVGKQLEHVSENVNVSFSFVHWNMNIALFEAFTCILQ
jgi:hypothetical protein